MTWSVRCDIKIVLFCLNVIFPKYSCVIRHLCATLYISRPLPRVCVVGWKWKIIYWYSFWIMRVTGRTEWSPVPVFIIIIFFDSFRFKTIREARNMRLNYSRNPKSTEINLIAFWFHISSNHKSITPKINNKKEQTCCVAYAHGRNVLSLFVWLSRLPH